LEKQEKKNNLCWGLPGYISNSFFSFKSGKTKTLSITILGRARQFCTRARAHHFKNICTRTQFLNLHSRSALKSENIFDFF